MALEVPAWPLPAGVLALTSTRAGGVSKPPFDSFNLACHVGDAPDAVAANRARLARCLPGRPRLRWLRQVHGVAVCDDGGDPDLPADAAVSRVPGNGCVVLTADCLPVLLCARDGAAVGAVHAGWRGLAAGVLERALAALGDTPEQVSAWLGPAVGPAAFEVGPEVRAAFREGWRGAPGAVDDCFRAGRRDRLHADLQALARLRLRAAGVGRIQIGRASCRERVFPVV